MCSATPSRCPFANVVRLLVRLNCPRTFSGVIFNGPKEPSPSPSKHRVPPHAPLDDGRGSICSSSSGDDDTGVSIPPTATSNGKVIISREADAPTADYQARVKEMCVRTLRKLAALPNWHASRRQVRTTTLKCRCRSRARKILTAVDEFAENSNER